MLHVLYFYIIFIHDTNIKRTKYPSRVRQNLGIIKVGDFDTLPDLNSGG